MLAVTGGENEGVAEDAEDRTGACRLLICKLRAWIFQTTKSRKTLMRRAESSWAVQPQAKAAEDTSAWRQA